MLFPWWIKYPNSNNEILNLDWLEYTVKHLSEEVKNFINLNTIKYADPILWDITMQYEANTVVVDGRTGNAYISTRAVPSGVQLNRTEYWTQIYNYADVVDTLREQIAHNEGESTTATIAYSVNDLVFVGGELYRVIAPMIAGDSFVVNSNVEKTTIENELERLQTNIGNEATARNNADILLQTNIDNEAIARANADNALRTEINNIFNRRFMMVGDSYGVAPSNNDNCVETFKSIAGLSDSECYNRSVIGAGITLNNSYYNAIVDSYDHVENHDTITDIVIFGGYNDIDRGTMANVTSECEYIKSYCKSNYPKAKVWYIFCGQYRDTIPDVVKYKLETDVETLLYNISKSGIVTAKRADSCLIPFDCVDSTDHVHPTSKGAARLGAALYELLYLGDFSNTLDRYDFTLTNSNGTVIDFNSGNKSITIDNEFAYINLRLQTTYTNPIVFTNSVTASIEVCDYSSDVLSIYGTDFVANIPGASIIMQISGVWYSCVCDVAFVRGKIFLLNCNLFDSGSGQWTSGNITSIIIRGFTKIPLKFI